MKQNLFVSTRESERITNYLKTIEEVSLYSCLYRCSNVTKQLAVYRGVGYIKTTIFQN